MRVVCISSLESTPLPQHKGPIINFSRISPELFVVATDSSLIFVRNGQTEEVIEWPVDDGGAHLVSMHVVDGVTIVTVFSNALVLSVDVESRMTEERILEVASGVVAVGWNDADATVAILTQDDTVVLLDSLLDVIAENTLHTMEEGTDQLITVGWGSKETQFQGSAGKAAREKKEEEKKEVDSRDTKGSSVQWREDGQVFMVNHYHKDTSSRSCSIWNKECRLVSRLLSSFPLQEACCIRPIGNLFAVASKNTMIMGEKNGERRNGTVEVEGANEGGFIRKASWNVDGSLMAIEVEKENDKTFLQLWLCSNLEWSCKLSLPLETLQSWKWDGEKTNLLSIVTRGQLVDLLVAVTHSSIDEIVVTVSSLSLRVCDTNRVIMPPPLSPITLSLSSPISILAFNRNTIAVITQDRQLIRFNRDESSSRLAYSTPPSSHSVSIPSDSIITAFSLVSTGYIVAISSMDSHRISIFDLEGKETKSIVVDVAVVRILQKDDGDTVFIDSKGRVYKGIDGKREDLFTIQGTLVKAAVVNSSSLCALSSDGSLLLDGILLSKHVSSFSSHSSLIAYIDHSFQLSVKDILNGEEATKRSVEKGSQMVALCPPKIVMQMTRGNLETIHSRFLVERCIRKMLDEGLVVEAIKEMKRLRIDYSLLYHHSPQFLFDPSSWISSIDDPDLLSLLISQLSHMPEGDRVCESVSLHIFSLPPSHLHRLFPALLSSLLYKSPPDVDRAITAIVEHLPKDSSRSNRLKEWLHVCSFTMTQSAIFKACLGSYDLAFVVEAVEALALDPNEYLHTLNELNSISDDSYRRYRIDFLREDWKSALNHLSVDYSRIEEAKKLVKERNLYSFAVQLYMGKQGMEEMVRMAIDECKRKAEWKEAASLARLLRNTEEEITCWEKTTEVEEWITTVRRLNGEEKSERIEKMQEKLWREEKWNMLSDLMHCERRSDEKAVQAHANAREWKRLGRITVDNEETEKRRREYLEERVDLLISEVNEGMEEVKRMATRLEVVRELKKEKIEKIKKGELHLEDIERIEVFSESSLASSRSRSSRSSAVSRRTKKVEKKKRSLREGGEWEDAALLIHIHNKWTALRAVFNEVSQLLPTLVSAGLFSHSTHLSTVISSLESTLSSLSPSIWPSRLFLHHLTGPVLSIMEEEGVDTVVSEGFNPSSFNLDTEMCAPPSLTKEELGWKFRLFH